MLFKDDKDKSKKNNFIQKANKISKILQPMKNIVPKKSKTSQKNLKPNKNLLSFNLIIKKNLKNYNITKSQYDLIMINNIICSNKYHSHLIVCYKENNLNDFLFEYLRRSYNIKDFKTRLPKISNYYHNYFLFFLKPTFRVSFANKIIKENGERQAKYFYSCHYENNDKNNEEKKIKKLDKNLEKIFNDEVKKDIDKSFNDDSFNKQPIPDISLNSYKYSNENSVKSLLNCFTNNNNNENNKNIKNIVPAIKNFNKIIKVEKRDVNLYKTPNKKKKLKSQFQFKKVDLTNKKKTSQTYRPIPHDKRISSKILSDLSISNSYTKNTSFNNKFSLKKIINNKKESNSNNKDNLSKNVVKNLPNYKSRNSNKKKLSLNLNFHSISQNENNYNTIMTKNIKKKLNLNELIDIFHTNTERNNNKNTINTSPTVNNININIHNNICINTNNNVCKGNNNNEKSRNFINKSNSKSVITSKSKKKIKNLKNENNMFKTNYIPYTERKPKNYISPISNISPRVNKMKNEVISKNLNSSKQSFMKTPIIKVQKAIFKKLKK